MRAAHMPFNSPLEYRNKSSVGILGDNVMEMDDMVGNIFKQLEKSGVKVWLGRNTCSWKEQLEKTRSWKELSWKK